MDSVKPRKIRKFACGVCSWTTDDIKDLLIHVESHLCSGCGETFQNTSDHACLVGRGARSAAEVINPSTEFMQKKEFSHRGALTTYSYDYIEDFVLFADAFNLVFPDLRNIVLSFLHQHVTIKTQMSFYITTKDNKTRQTENKVYSSTLVKILHKHYACGVLEFQLNTVISLINLFTNEKSGIAILRINKIHLTLAGIQHNTAGAYVNFPPALRGKSGLISIATKETNNCFILSVLNQLYGHMITHNKYTNIPYDKLPWRAKADVRRKMKLPSSYSHIIKHVKDNKLLEIDPFFGEVTLPMIDIFEKLNKVSVNVHTFDAESNKTFPTRITIQDYKYHVNLLLLKSAKNDSFHYVSIHNPSKFFCLGKRNLRILCRFCCFMFSKKMIEKHTKECHILNKMNIAFPKDNCYSFKSFQRCMSSPFKISADLLSCSDTSENGEVKAIGYCILGFGPDESLLFQSNYVGQDAVKFFLFNLVSCAEMLLVKQREENVPLEYDQVDILGKSEILSCQLCDEAFSQENNPSNMHHHHILNDNETYLDPHLPNKISYLCTRCNLALKPSNHIPVFLHMATKTTMHLLLEAIKTTMVKRLQIIPRNVEGYLSLYCPGLFKTVSLENFISNDFISVFEHYRGDQTYDKYFININKHFAEQSIPLLFPHLYENPNQFTQKKMPEREECFDIVHNRIPSPSEYADMKAFFNRNELCDLNAYASDHLLFRAHAINAIFQSLNFWTLKNYKISVHHEHSLAGLAYSSAMFLCKESYSFLKDADLTKKLCENIIGGISYMGERHVESNTERLGSCHVDDNNRIELLCSDVQSLYMYAMLRPLPFSDYKMIEGDAASNFNPFTVNEENEISYLVCASLQYPAEIKQGSSDFPFLPTRETVYRSELGEMQRDIYQQCMAQQDTAPGIHHVLLTQHDKNRVLIHLEHLKFLLGRGMILTSIHYLIQFKQKAFLKPYIEHTLAIRNKSTSSLEKQLAKNMGNLLYGKFFGAGKSYRIGFCTNEVDFKKKAAKEDFENAIVFNENLSMLYHRRKTLLYDKNLLVAYTVLEISKLRFYQLIYSLKDYFGDRLRICGAETDSIVAACKDENKTFLSDLKALSSIFDYSTLPVEHVLYNTERKGVAGLFKLEYIGAVEWIKLRSKVWAIKSVCSSCLQASGGFELCDDCMSRVNGSTFVCKGGVKHDEEQFELYRKALQREANISIEYYQLKAKGESVQLLKRNRKLINSIDVKRKWNDDLLTSTPFGALPEK